EHEQGDDENHDQTGDADLGKHVPKRSASGCGQQGAMPKKPISEQVLVVTGASSGLGRAIARLAGERGAKVVVTARNAEALKTACGRSRAPAPRPWPCPATSPTARRSSAWLPRRL